MTAQRQALIIGGGIAGLTTAYEMARRGCAVTLIDRQATGREASWAGGGILSPIHPHRYPAPLAELCRLSQELTPALMTAIEEDAGFSVEHRMTGILRLASGEANAAELEALAAFHEAQGNTYRRISGDEARELEPAINPRFDQAIHEPGIAQVRNPRLLKALAAACARRGARIYEACPAEALIVEGPRVVGARTPRGELRADETILCAGPWSGGLVERSLGRRLPVVPVHGEMILIETCPPLLKSIVIHEGFYLIPRADGQLLAGSTLEDRGFDKRLRLGSLLQLLTQAIDLAPALADHSWKQAWAGLRPATADRLPFLGRLDGIKGLTIATGHYRNGLLLGPATATLAADIALGESPAIPVAPYDPSRDMPAFSLSS